MRGLRQLRPRPCNCRAEFEHPAGNALVGDVEQLLDIAERRGSGTLRLTVWQNLLISDIPEA
jgi:sulfite reductase beta subunit-like hemoprotein